MKALVLLLCLIALPAWAAPPEPEGYRQDNFRAPTPASLNGAHTVGSAQAEALWRDHAAVFIDVLPATLGSGIHHGKWLPAKPRQDIPGSLWLPNVGYGALEPEIERYFRANLPADQPVLFYCLTDCWMSWNAAKRAVSWGRAAVYWYPAGSDGWAERGLPLEDAVPVPITE